jgi:putative restriction endonuclease
LLTSCRLPASTVAVCFGQRRLDGEHGLLLTPGVDHLFDRGFIGFDGDGALIVSPVAHRESLERMGIDPRRSTNVGVFLSGQKRYLEFHRDNVLLKSSFFESS